MPTSANVARVRTRLHATLDEDTPAIDLRITGVIREGSNVVTPAAECDELYVGDRLIGSYAATDRRCRQIKLHVRTNPHPCSRPTVFQPTSDDPRPPDGTWELHTADMRPCGYTLTLRIVDQTIDGDSTRCCGSVALDFRLEPRSAAPSPRPVPHQRAWNLTSPQDPAACQ